MDPKIKNDFLVALRSGEYKHTKGALKHKSHSGVRHCAGGVLCELAVKAGVIDEAVEMETFTGFYRFGSSASFVPTRVADWAGLSRPYHIAMLNDAANNYDKVIEYVEGL